MAALAKATSRRVKKVTARAMVLIVEIALLALVVYFLGRLIWLLAFGVNVSDFEEEVDYPVSSAAPVRYVADLDVLLEAPLFADRRAGQAIQQLVEIAPETELNLVLRGVRRDDADGNGAAIIQTPDNQQHFFPIGSEILDGVTLAAVRHDHVVLRRRGVMESLYLRDESQRQVAASVSTVSANETSSSGDDDGISRQDLMNVFQLRQAIVNGRFVGYRLTGTDVSVLEDFGFQTGDVVTAINGIPLSDSINPGSLLEANREGDALLITVTRSGVSLTIQLGQF